MRISTTDVFDIGSRAIVDGQAGMMKTQQQLSSGRKSSSPADDPIAASEALRLRQAAALNAQYQGNQKAALGTLGQVESTLGDVTGLLQQVRTSVVAAGNSSLTDSDRQAIAQDIAGRLEQLIGYANSTDGTGRYLFGGYSDTAQPFTKSGTGVVYNGDQGGRALQVSDSRTIDVSANGSHVFERIPTGNGTFVASAAAANTGAGIVSTGKVTNAAALATGHSYQVVIDPSGTTYTVNDTTGGAPGTAVAGQASLPYTSGSAISFDGMQIDISGQPAAGDVFDVKPSTSQNVFATLQNLVTLLNTPVSGSAGRAALANGVAGGLTNIDNAFDNVLSYRTAMGSRMNEVQSLGTVMDDRNLAIQTALSQVEDVDYADAISRLSRQQMMLEAAQKSFVSTTHLSLFSFL
jgi:flagellar hook-associated protein 3 FlgL